MTTLVQDVVELLRSCGFDVREGAGDVAVTGSLDSAAVLIEQLLEVQEQKRQRFHWAKDGMFLDPNGFYVHADPRDDIS